MYAMSCLAYLHLQFKVSVNRMQVSNVSRKCLYNTSHPLEADKYKVLMLCSTREKCDEKFQVHSTYHKIQSISNKKCKGISHITTHSLSSC